MRSAILFVFLMVSGLVVTAAAVKPAAACTPYSLSSTKPRGYAYCTSWVRLGIVYLNGIPHRQYSRKCSYWYAGRLLTNTFYTYCDIR